jgi:hypothetical protein
MKDNQPQKDNLIKICHNRLCSKVSWYANWDKNPQSNLVHLFLLSALIIFFLQYDFPGITNKVAHVINGAQVESSTDFQTEETPAPEYGYSSSGDQSSPEEIPAPAEETPVPEEAPVPPAEETPVPVVIAPVINPAPVIRSVSSPIIKGTFHSGVVPIIVVFNKAVEVSGTPQLILSTGTPDTTAVDLKYAFGNRLYFLYHIVSGNSSDDLDYASSSAIDLNGGSIRGLSGNNADLTLPEPGSSGSLSGKNNIVIETEPDAV